MARIVFRQVVGTETLETARRWIEIPQIGHTVCLMHTKISGKICDMIWEEYLDGRIYTRQIIVLLFSREV